MSGLSENEGGTGHLGLGDDRLSEMQADNARLRALLAEREEELDRLRAAAQVDAQVRKLADSLPVLISYIGADQRYLYNNKAYETWFGRRRGELFGQTLRDALGDMAYESFRPLVEAALAGDRVSTDMPVTYPDGLERHIHVDYVPNRRADGSVAGFYSLVRDITESKRNELALRESEARFRAMADSAPSPVWVTDENGIAFANRALAEFAGRPAEDLLGQGWAEIVHPDDLADVRASRDAAWAGGDINTFDARLRRHDGEWRWFHASLKPRFDEGGRRLGFVGMAADVTDAKRAEAELRESEARCRAMADCAPSPVWVTNAEGIEFVNQAFVEVAGRPAEEVIGGYWMEIIHPDELPEVLAKRAEAWASGSAYGYEARFQRADGEWRWMDVSCRPRFDVAGSLIGYVGLAVDVTEQKRIEAELRESEARFRLMADSAPAPVWVTNDAGIEFANRGLANFTGLSVEALQGDTWMRLAHPDDIEAVQRQRLEAWAARAPYEFEARFRRHDGEWRWLRCTCKPRESDAAMLGYVGLAIDVTEARKAEQELRASEDRLRLATEAAAIGTWDFNPVSGELRWDARCKALFGLPEDAFVDYDVFLAGLHPDDRAHTDAAVQRALDPNGPGDYDIEYRTLGLEDRVERWVAATGRAVFEAGRAVRFIGTILDISERKRAEVLLAQQEEALRDLNASLEARIESAIAERERVEAALRQAQKMEAVGQLTGGIAHDFNNLLTVIGGNLDLAARRLGPAVDPRVRDAIGSAMNGAERAATLTQRLLAFSRRQPLAPKPTDANALLAGMSELLHRTLGERVEVETRLTAGVARIEVDPHQLESAILNLAVNARDAMPEGGRLTIETAAARLDAGKGADGEPIAPGAYVVIAVSDTGMGMNADTLRRAVEPFFTTKEVGKGTGLGLSMVYGFVRQSGGQLQIDSEVGRGTHVRIYLPRLVAEPVEEEQAEAAAAPHGGGDEVILVCEDDEDVRAYTVELLKELGYQVLEAADGAATLNWLRDADQRIDMLFTDVVLPGTRTGADLARDARALRPGLKVLYTTGYARDAIVHEGRLDAGVELITKPFGFADLATRVRDLLDRR